jgi:hypothetical protein
MSILRFAALAILVTGCLDRPIAESSPTTSNVFVDQVEQSGVDKIDLLFMVDNSTSMADKQEILQSAVPVLVRRLTSPICVDSVTGAPTGENSMAGHCTKGEPEFNAVADIHVGIVTSSLGSHGGNGPNCNMTGAGLTPNDQAHLLGTVRPAGSNADPKLTFDVANTWNNTGFLAWDANLKDQPPGVEDAGLFEGKFANMIAASGEQGCGYEASLESWYRFLVDPEPPANVTRTTANLTSRGSALITNPDGSTTCKGCDLELLAQRKAFLRPDSLVAIVMLSDENDCSIRDDGQGWLVASTKDVRGNPLRMPRSTAVCATDPNDPCCRSCASAETAPPKGCGKLSDDDVCKVVPAGQNYATWDEANDSLNLRCYDQMKRFGFDLLYPTSRYVDALSKPTLTLQSDGKTQVPNPLYAAPAGSSPRDPAQVFFAGIVGVPWQDIADDASLSGPGLKYLSADELVAKGRWNVLLGDPSAHPPVPPADPFMIETPSPRSGNNPITHDAIMPPTSTSPTASPINGHEQNVPSSNVDDLQYACTFALKTPKACPAGDNSCDCAADSNGSASAVTAANSPLCQPPSGGAATTEQSYAKAYPGIRELEVLKGLKNQGVVASICPKVTASADDPAGDPNYGYNPAVAAIIDRLKADLIGRCLPRAVQVNPKTHQALCKVIEAQPGPGTCNCNALGRAVPDAQIVPAVERELKANGHCGEEGQAACSSFCQCEILQETSDAALNACRQGAPPPAGSPPGYCYVDDPASPVVKNCPSNEKRKLQFVSVGGQQTPALGAVAFIACLGAPLASVAPN